MAGPVIEQLAEKVAQQLEQRDDRLVLAESCTAGLIAATLGLVPGISRFLCGSAVVYREKTKVEWLGVSEQTLAEHSAVSEAASSEIARGVLQKTPEATIALGITGHFGPNAPDGLDGVVFLSLRTSDPSKDPAKHQNVDRRVQLKSDSRSERQSEAVEQALAFLNEALNGQS